MRRILAASLAFLGISNHPVAPEDVSRPEETTIQSLLSPNVGERLRARRVLLNERRSLVRSLVALAGSEKEDGGDRTTALRNWNSPKHLAVSLLGELRADEAIPVLTKNITYRVIPLVGGLETRLLGRQFPAAWSLVQIGHPTVPAILQILRETGQPLERQLCIWILIQIDGRDVARLRVENAIKERGPYTTWRANLEAALEYFDKEDLDFPPPEESGKTEGKGP